MSLIWKNGRPIGKVKHLYNVWVNMKTRCFNKNSPDFVNYGGRDITVCNEWIKFKGFLKDMELDFEEGLTIDRIDNNKGYSKENCSWVNRIIQNNNKRNTRKITFKGLSMTLSRWANYLGIKKSTLDMRVYAYGWNIKRALSTQVRSKSF